jgi:hypothetical protein
MKLYHVTVEKDCTGTLVRIDLKDYMVPNTDKTDSFKDGQVVRVRYKKLKSA